MVREIRLYFEGNKKLRQGFRRFLQSPIDLARQHRVQFKLIAADSKAEAIRDFMTAVCTHSTSLNFLLVDSDCPDKGNLIASIREHANWDAKVDAGIRDDQLHFMVQVMETWFLADRDTLQNYYGKRFHGNRLAGNPKVEEIPKGDVIQGLEEATRDSPKGKYHKTKHASDLLTQIDMSKVCSAAPSAQRLIASLHQSISPENRSL